MALGDERRNTGKNNEASRRNTGAANENARRNIGRTNEASRRGESVQEDINRLVSPPRQRATLKAIPPIGGVPATRGTGTYKPPTTGRGSGVAWPLTEPDASDREFWPDKLLSSPDGLIAMIIKPIKSVTLQDENGIGGKMKLADPAAPPIPGP